MSEYDLKDLNHAILVLLCKSWFKNTDAYFILTRLDHHAKANEGIDARAAASLAIMDYVSEWLYQQIRVNG